MPITIVAASPLEIAALKAIFIAADAQWFDNFPANVMHYLYDELGLINDDDGAMLDLNELSDLMVRWQESLK